MPLREVQLKGTLLLMAVGILVCFGFLCASAEAQSKVSTQDLVVFGAAQPDIPDAVLQDIAAGFEKENPGIHVVWNFKGKWGDYVQLWTTARLAGEQVDIQFTGANALRAFLLPKQFAMDLTDITKNLRGRFVPSTLDDYTVDGRLWALPLRQVSTCTWYYNKDLFAKAGAIPPKSYAELKQVAAKLKSIGVEPAIHQGKDKFMWPIWYFETFAQTSGNRSIEDTLANLAGTRKFTEAPDVQALDLLAGFFRDGILGQDTLQTDAEGMRAAFLNGTVAMYYNGTWEIPSLRQAGVFQKFDVGVFEFPPMFAGAKPQHGGGCDRGIGISSGIAPERIGVATRFLEYMTRKDVATKYLTPMDPIYTSIVGGPKSSLPIAQDLSRNHFPHTITFLDWIWPAEIADAFKAGIQNVASGQQTAAQAMQAVQDTFDGMRNEGYRFDYWNTWSKEDWQKVTPAAQ